MEAGTLIKDEEIQQQILQAAKRLFQQHGFRRVTIDDIARAVGKARSSLYYYHKTKEEILDAVIAAEINELITAIAAAVNDEPTAEGKIKAFFITQLQIVLQKRGFFIALDEDMAAGELVYLQKTKLAIFQQLRDRESALLKEILIRGIDRGEINDIRYDDLNDLIFALLGSLHGIKRELVIKNDLTDLERPVSILVRSIFNGLNK